MRKRLGKFPIVLHGASCIPQKYAKIINDNGGSLTRVFGIPEAQLKKATKYGICKINIATDSRMVFTAMIRKYLAENPDQIGPRKYLGLARQEFIEMIKQRNVEVIGSADQAKYI